jgi:hypothetical protein
VSLSAAVQAAVSDDAPVGLRVALLVVLGVGGLAVGVTGWLGWRGVLRRNRFVGVRTPATLRDERTFEVANRVAGPPVTVAGVVMVVAGVVALVVPGVAGVVVAGAVGGLGGLVFAGAGGVLGHRVAAAMPEVRAPGGCGGCCTQAEELSTDDCRACPIGGGGR